MPWEGSEKGILAADGTNDVHRVRWRFAHCGDAHSSNAFDESALWFNKSLFVWFILEVWFYDRLTTGSTDWLALI